MSSRIISPSILAADFGRLTEQVQLINRSSAEWLHVDVMDGVFVPNISFGFPIMQVLKKESTKPLDVHLMITNPERYVERFCDAGAWSVGFHLEAVEDPMPILEMIRQKGCRTCLTINPDIDVSRLIPYLEEVDMVLLMSVFAGYGGQSFIESTFDKLKLVKDTIVKKNLSTLIEIDGGVNRTNAGKLFAAGADVLVAGTSVFNAADPIAEIDILKSASQ
mgnify:FL=1